jgi:hypothetical protein
MQPVFDQTTHRSTLDLPLYPLSDEYFIHDLYGSYLSVHHRYLWEENSNLAPPSNILRKINVVRNSSQTCSILKFLLFTNYEKICRFRNYRSTNYGNIYRLNIWTGKS